MSTREQKQTALSALYAQHALCDPCIFGKKEPQHKVFGEGNPDAILMCIGEAPGAEEDRLKRPFVGRSGKLLDQIFQEAGFSRDQIFITNIVKCRPPNNKTPLPHEILPEAKALLKQEIGIIKPSVICTLGSTATQLFLAEKLPLSRVRGKQLLFPKSNIIVIPTYHPAYILRNPAAKEQLVSDIIAAYDLAKKIQF